MRSLREAFRTARGSLHCERELKETPPRTAAELIKVGIDSSPCSGALYKLARLRTLTKDFDPRDVPAPAFPKSVDFPTAQWYNFPMVVAHPQQA